MLQGFAMLQRFGLYGLLLITFQVLGGCSGQDSSTSAAQQPTNSAVVAEEVKDAPLVIAFGDSLYSGYNLNSDEGLAPQLQAGLRAKGRVVRVLNAGVAGDTSAAGKQRLAFVLDSAPKKPELLLLGLGGNDMLRGIKPQETRANLAAILDELKKRDIKVLLTGMLASPNMGDDYAKQYNALYPELAKKYKADLYPFILDGVAANRGMQLADGIHPNAAGVKHIVEALLPLVERNLKNER